MHELIRITKKWLDPDKNSAAALVEAVVVDRYLWALPYEAKKVISHSAPVTASALVEAVEQYQATNEMLHMGKREQLLPPGRQANARPPPPPNPTQGNSPRQMNIKGPYQVEPEQRQRIPDRETRR